MERQPIPAPDGTPIEGTEMVPAGVCRSCGTHLDEASGWGTGQPCPACGSTDVDDQVVLEETAASEGTTPTMGTGTDED